MKKSRFMTVALAAMLILSLTACGGEKKPAETKGSVQASQETTAVAAKETEAAAKETTEKETEPLETEAKIPENAEEITMTNQKLQVQAKVLSSKTGRRMGSRKPGWKRSGYTGAEKCL